VIKEATLLVMNNEATVTVITVQE